MIIKTFHLWQKKKGPAVGTQPGASLRYSSPAVRSQGPLSLLRVGETSSRSARSVEVPVEFKTWYRASLPFDADRYEARLARS